MTKKAEQIVAEALYPEPMNQSQHNGTVPRVVAALREAGMLASPERDRFIAEDALYKTGYAPDLTLQFLDVNYPHKNEGESK